jgi:tetratricopeptide (TPR) repeat protein/NAD-dependent dihydropyrimidine dehydrogenase PreA subunit
MAAHVVQWWWTGQTVSPIEPSESMYTLQRGFVNAGFIFFSLAILATLIFGRFVCGWGCHIVALQDLCAWMLKKVGLKPRPFRSRLLVFVPLIVALYMFVWPVAARFLAKAPDDPLFPQFTNHIVTTEFWATFPTIAVAIPFLFICGFMTVYFLGSKGFCTYACPYGGIFGVVDKIAPGRIRVTDACNECGHCTAVCTSNVIVHAEVKQYGMVVDPGCMKCMDCISVCPNDALYFGFGRPAVGVKKTATRNYSLTWPEEILAAVVFAVSYFAVWDVYQIVPMLMALGIACVTTFLVVRCSKLIRSKDLTFYRSMLKSEGRLRLAGWLFLAFAALWTGLNAHSGLVRYHEWAGMRAYAKIQVPDELALAEADPAQWLNSQDRTNVEVAKNHFYNAFDAGFIVNTEVVTRVAWLEHLSGNTEQALRLFSVAIVRQHDAVRALSLYYRGAILNRTGRYQDALGDLDAALDERPDLVAALEERGEALWQLGRRAEAIAAWKEAAAGNAVVAGYMLAGASMLNGDAAASAYEAESDSLAPDDPYFHWMVGLRLRNVGMKELAEKHFQRAVQLDPRFILRQRTGRT